jgi:hypothetical protein
MISPATLIAQKTGKVTLNAEQQTMFAVCSEKAEASLRITANAASSEKDMKPTDVIFDNSPDSSVIRNLVIDCQEAGWKTEIIPNGIKLSISGSHRGRKPGMKNKPKTTVAPAVVTDPVAAVVSV